MCTPFEQKLTSSHKNEMIAYLSAHPHEFEEAVQLALADKQPYSWRASWLLWSCMEENDGRIRKHVPEMIRTLPEKNDSQKREFLKILSRMKIDEELEGMLFDHCVTIWENIQSQPAVRFNAFKLILRIAQLHPELLNEVKLLTRSEMLDTLSPGAKHSVSKMLAAIAKTRNNDEQTKIFH